MKLERRQQYVARCSYHGLAWCQCTLLNLWLAHSPPPLHGGFLFCKNTSTFIFVANHLSQHPKSATMICTNFIRRFPNWSAWELGLPQKCRKITCTREWEEASGGERACQPKTAQGLVMSRQERASCSRDWNLISRKVLMCTGSLLRATLLVPWHQSKEQWLSEKACIMPTYESTSEKGTKYAWFELPWSYLCQLAGQGPYWFFKPFLSTRCPCIFIAACGDYWYLSPVLLFDTMCVCPVLRIRAVPCTGMTNEPSWL